MFLFVKLHFLTMFGNTLENFGNTMVTPKLRMTYKDFSLFLMTY